MNSYTIGSKLTIFYVVSTRLLSASDFLFSFVKLTSLTFPDVFLEHSNWRGMFISEPSFMARVTCIRHYSCCYLKVGNPYILTGIIPVSESVSLSLLEAANNSFSSELYTFFSSSFSLIISCGRAHNRYSPLTMNNNLIEISLPFLRSDAAPPPFVTLGMG